MLDAAFGNEKKMALNKQKQWVHYDSHIYIIYPLVNIQKSMGNHNFQWVNPLQIAMFNSYVKLPEGISFNIPVESQVGKTRLLTQLLKTHLSKCPFFMACSHVAELWAVG